MFAVILTGIIGVVFGYVIGTIRANQRADSLEALVMKANDAVLHLTAQRDEARERVAKRRRLKAWGE